MILDHIAMFWKWSATESWSERGGWNTTAGYNTIGSINQGLNTSLQSVQSQTKNASLLSEHLNTDELEAIAQCFDNIREMRKRNPKMVVNDDNALGD